MLTYMVNIFMVTDLYLTIDISYVLFNNKLMNHYWAE